MMRHGVIGGRLQSTHARASEAAPQTAEHVKVGVASLALRRLGRSVTIASRSRPGRSDNGKACR